MYYHEARYKPKKSQAKKIALGVIGIMVATFVMLWVMDYGLRKQAIADCERDYSYERTYPLFEMSDDNKALCAKIAPAK